MLQLITGMSVVQSDGTVLVISKANDNLHLLRRHFGSLGLLGVISTITLSHVKSFDLTTKEEFCTLEDMVASKMHNDINSCGVLFEWYPISDRCRKVTHTKMPRESFDSVNHVGPAALEMYAGGLFTFLCTMLPNQLRCQFSPTAVNAYLNILGCTEKRGPWHNLFPADQLIDLNCMPMRLCEVLVPRAQVPLFFDKLRSYYAEYPEEMPYAPVTLDWIATDSSWIGKSSSTRWNEHPKQGGAQSAGGENWIAAVGVGHLQIEWHLSSEGKFSAVYMIAKDMNLRLHLGKVHNSITTDQMRKRLPAGNFDEFVRARRAADPFGLFLTEHWAQFFE